MSDNAISKQIVDQLVKKCIHFTGVMNRTCNAGVKYSDVIAGPLMFPCRQTGGTCSKAQYPTREEAEAKELELAKGVGAALNMYVLAKDEYKRTGKSSGTIKCSCGGMMFYSVAESNGHIRAKCPSCGQTFME